MSNTNTNYFLLRRLHSLLGVIPLGIFLVNHLLTNFTGIFGAEFFEHKVALIHALGPFLPVVEAVMIFIPLALHVAIGIYIAFQAKHSRLPYLRNYAFILQRATGWIALIFIAYHVVHLRFMVDMSTTPFSMELAEMFYGPSALFFIPFYIIGSLSVIFHFANGLCTFCMTWGITTGRGSQRRFAYAATGLGAALTIMMLLSIVGFYREGAKMAGMLDEDREAYVAKLLEIHHHSATPADVGPTPGVIP